MLPDTQRKKTIMQYGIAIYTVVNKTIYNDIHLYLTESYEECVQIAKELNALFNHGEKPKLARTEKLMHLAEAMLAFQTKELKLNPDHLIHMRATVCSQ